MTAPDLAAVLGLEALDSPAPLAFADILTRLYEAKFTGKVVLDFAGGHPRRVEFPQPVALPLEPPKSRT